ncbi:MAG: hypothetical protein ACK442_14410 [Novosphingobium sp.]|jgi:hypothetical protein|nr:hypothetical protein [Brevundimonas sp.]
MTDDVNDDMDIFLREHFAGPVPVGDFADRVMAQLPRQRRSKQVPLIVGGCIGVVMCWLSLWSAPVSQVARQDWLSGDLSEASIAMFMAMLGMAILALAWSIVETDDGWGPSPRGITR